MELVLKRIFKGDKYTIGRLYWKPPYIDYGEHEEVLKDQYNDDIEKEYICDTLEDTDRGLTKDMTLDEIKSIKQKGITAIPSGKYAITLDIQSPKFKNYKQYAFCDGYLPRLTGVPGFDGILIHIGNKPEDTDGCLLVGKNKVKGQVVESTDTFKKLYAMLKTANDNHEHIMITIE